MSGDRNVGDPRSPFQIDRDRILYSMPFRRLAGVTQVVSPDEGIIFHNRLTHSLKVAQIARRMAENFIKNKKVEVRSWGGIDPDVVEAAALAHDLGHPPFGHIAEQELNSLSKKEIARSNKITPDKISSIEGYEGNAQSFRILTELGVRRKTAQNGLDLTRATLNATLKYPWHFQQKKDEHDKYSVYRSDQLSFDFARRKTNCALEPYWKSLEAQIMDWADDITYSVHDTEDFYRAGLVPLDRLINNKPERRRLKDTLLKRGDISIEEHAKGSEFSAEFEGMFETVIEINDHFEGTKDQQHDLYAFVSNTITTFLKETELLKYPGNSGDALKIPDYIHTRVKILKLLTRVYVLENPSFAATQHGQRHTIRKLFKVLNEAVKAKRWNLFPPYYRERAEALTIPISTEKRVRLVTDTISSLTDIQATLFCMRLSGSSQSSMLAPVR